MYVFLFSDIENSTSLWEHFPHKMEQVLLRHNIILEACVAESGGRVVKNLGDGVFAVFEGGDPLGCSLDIQRQVAGEHWGIVADLRVRVTLNAGDAVRQKHDFFGPAVNRAAHLVDIGWGGQILLTGSVLKICEPPPDTQLQDLGIHLLKDLSQPTHVFQLSHPSLPLQQFPPLRSLSPMEPDALAEALTIAREFNVVPLALYTLIGVARLLSVQGKSATAAELALLVLNHPTNTDFTRAKAEELLRELQNELSPSALAGVWDRAASADLWEMTNQVLVEMDWANTP